MQDMSFREMPAGERTDAEILAAILGLIPVRSGEMIRLMPRQGIMDRIEELRIAGDEDEAYRLLADLEFDGEAVFKNCFSQMASRSVRVRTSTLYRMLEVMAGTKESRNDLLQRLLAPLAAEALDEIAESADERKIGLLRFSLDGWAKARRTGPEEIYSDDVGGNEGAASRPVLRTRLENGDLPEDLRKYARYFLKNLFRLNNIHGRNEFVHPPEVVENYWEIISPDQGTFHAELAPASKSFAVGLYHISKSFGLERSENADYYGLLEMLVSEMRGPRIKGCRVEVHGANREDDLALQELLSIETVLIDEPPVVPRPAGIPQPMSPEGLELFRTGLQKLSGIRAEVLFPVNPRDPDCGLQDYSMLGFDLVLDPASGRFLLDDAEVSAGTMDQLVLAVGGKLLALSRQLYRDPARFPQPDVDVLDTEVHALIAKAEREGLDDGLARDIVAKITVLDYYESLAKYSYALSDQIRRYLEGTQVVTFTVPRVLLALLDRKFEQRGIDDIVLAGLEGRGSR
jgi:hypothetical protein